MNLCPRVVPRVFILLDGDEARGDVDEATADGDEARADGDGDAPLTIIGSDHFGRLPHGARVGHPHPPPLQVQVHVQVQVQVQEQVQV